MGDFLLILLWRLINFLKSLLLGAEVEITAPPISKTPPPIAKGTLNLSPDATSTTTGISSPIPTNPIILAALSKGK